MADIGENILAAIHQESMAAFSEHMVAIRDNSAMVSMVVNASSAKQFDEMGPEAARAVDKVLQLPKTT